MSNAWRSPPFTLDAGSSQVPTMPQIGLARELQLDAKSFGRVKFAYELCCLIDSHRLQAEVSSRRAVDLSRCSRIQIVKEMSGSMRNLKSERHFAPATVHLCLLSERSAPRAAPNERT
jgi:hypothetical protein